MKLPEFFLALDHHAENVPLDDLVALMKQLEITRDDVADVVRFGEKHYERNLLQLGSGYSALILCWRAGQRSTIHDHRGSACGVRVVQGTASETVYERGADGLVRPVRSATYVEGSVCGSYDADIHAMFNERADGGDLVTLHVYTPPLREVRTYEEGSTHVGTWTDELTLNAQKRSVVGI